MEYLKNNTWVFTEKVDGTNIRIYWDGHKVTYGGRTERSNIPAHLMNKLIELFGNEETEQLFEQINIFFDVLLDNSHYFYTFANIT